MSHAVRIAVDPFPDDVSLARLWLSAWGNPGPDTFQPVLRKSLAHLGAYDGDVLVGFVNVAGDGGIHAFILDTCVDPAYRRRGLATRLVKAATETARSRGAKWLHVDFEPHLAAFYAGCGFRSTAAGLIAL
jgi:GNAT superfamily N-acetyltransferase